MAEICSLCWYFSAEVKQFETYFFFLHEMNVYRGGLVRSTAIPKVTYLKEPSGFSSNFVLEGNVT
jgi:hypothetical protein